MVKSVFTLLFSFHIDFAKKWLVELEFLSIHLALGRLRLLLVNLLRKEFSVFAIDLLYLIIQPFLFVFIVRLVTSPNIGLLVKMSLRVLLPVLFLSDLPRQKQTHLLFLQTLTLKSVLVLSTFTHLLLHLVTHQIIVLFGLFLGLSLDYFTCHSILELLCTLFSGVELSFAVFFFLCHDTNILFLRMKIIFSLFHAVKLSLCFVSFVFNQHFL
jgi:hypothetical protein